MVKTVSGVSMGPSTDRTNTPVIDPTENVKALTEAANLRQDDLRIAMQHRVDLEINHTKEIMELRGAFNREIRELETSRLNSIRQVDIQNQTIAADRALQATQALERTTQANAETLRALVSTTSAALAKQTQDTVQGITERIAALERAGYLSSGGQEGKKDTFGAIRTTILFIATIAAFLIGSLLPFFKR